MKDRYLAAPPFRRYLDGVVKNRELWHAVWDRVRLPEELIEEARRESPPWHLLALSEDWCGDAVNLLPVVGRFAEAVGWELKVLGRDTNLDLMDAHLTNGSRSIPVIMLLDGDYRERAWWGPRPAELQAWVMDEGRALPSEDRYKEIRRWYARDRGWTTLREILDLALEAAAAV